MISIVVTTLDIAVKHTVAGNRLSLMLEMTLIGQCHYVLVSLKSLLKD